MRAEPEEERELHSRLHQLVRLCNSLPPAILANYLPRVNRLTELINASLGAKMLDTVTSSLIPRPRPLPCPVHCRRSRGCLAHSSARR